VSLQGDHGNWPIQRTDKNLKRKKWMTASWL
jgi:hypothetical protein